MDSRNLPIPEPCTARWDDMSGDSLRRHCGQCDRHVHDLSAHTELEARALLASGQRLCVRYRSSAAGRILFRAPQRKYLPLLAGAALAGCVEPDGGVAASGAYLTASDAGPDAYLPPYDDEPDAGVDPSDPFHFKADQPTQVDADGPLPCDPHQRPTLVPGADDAPPDDFDDAVDDVRHTMGKMVRLPDPDDVPKGAHMMGAVLLEDWP